METSGAAGNGIQADVVMFHVQSPIQRTTAALAEHLVRAHELTPEDDELGAELSHYPWTGNVIDHGQ